MPLTHRASKTGGPNEGRLLKRAVLVSLALLVGGPLAAGEMESPVITLSDVNWDAAAATLPDHGGEPPAEAFARLNAITDKRFAGIDKSTVPVLLPFDVDAFRKDVADGKPEAATSDKYFGSFPSDEILPARPGRLRRDLRRNKDDGLNIRFEQADRGRNHPAPPSSTTLDGPNHIEKEDPAAEGVDRDSFPASAAS